MASRTKAAKEELKQALATIEQLQKRVVELQEYLRVDQSLRASSKTAQSKRSNAAKMAIADAAANLLIPGGHLKTPSIVSMLEKSGITIPSENKIAYLSQLLSRDSRFVASRKYGWTLVSANKPLTLIQGGGTS